MTRGRADGARRPRWGRRVALLVLLGLAVVAAFGWVWLHDRPSEDATEKALVVPRGASVGDVVARIEAAGLTEHPLVLGLALRIDGVMGTLRAGTYAIPGNAHALEIVEILGRPPNGVDLMLTLIPGETVWEHARRIEALGLGTAAEVEALAADLAFARELGLPVSEREARPDGQPQTYLEGFLFPETYAVAPGASARDAVVRAVEQYRREWAALAKTHATDIAAIEARYGLDEAQLVTLASLVEREVRAPEEAARVAGVFYNRLAKGMRLQTDPTLVYRKDRVGLEPTKAHRLDATNPYNTYARGGLPPGPIASPSRRSLMAVLRPERHDLLYFVARRDARGTHAFARTLEEHDANIDRYLR